MKKNSFLFTLLAAILAMSFTGGPTGYKPGDTARDFSLKNVDGKMVSLESMKGVKGYIVVFTCNHCPFAKIYEQRIIDLHKKYAPLGYPVVAISSTDVNQVPEDSYDNMIQRSKEKQYPYVYLLDETQEVAKAYGAQRTPHVFVLDANRVVKYIGAIDNNAEDGTQADYHYVADALDALIAGKDVKIKETKAIGCGIKWRS